MMHWEMPVPHVRRSGTDMARAWEAELESPDDAGDAPPFEDQQPAEPYLSAASKVSATSAAELHGAAPCHSASKHAEALSRRRQEMRTSISTKVAIRFRGYGVLCGMVTLAVR